MQVYIIHSLFQEMKKFVLTVMLLRNEEFLAEGRILNKASSPNQPARIFVQNRGQKRQMRNLL